MTKEKTSNERLALELLLGRLVRTKDGRLKQEYLSGSRERQAKVALARVINRYMQTEGEDAHFIKVALIVALTGITGGRELIFQSCRQGRPSTLLADGMVDRYVAAKKQECGKTEAAIECAMKEFGLSRKTVFAARRRWRGVRKRTLQEAIKSGRVV